MIETVIGLSIIAIAFYVLIAVFITLAPRTALVETLDKKTFLAQEKIEEYLARSFAQTSNEAAASFTGSLANYKYQVITTYVATSDLNAAVAGPTNLKNVKVRVWGGPVDSASSVEVVTLVVSYETQ